MKRYGRRGEITMFQFFKKKKGVEVNAVVKGIVKNLSEVQDPVFSQGLAGRGIAIVPEEGTFKAPCDGTLTAVFPTGHAFGITDKDGIEYLIHIGIDTVNLGGEGFDCLIKQGESVKKGDVLVKVDLSILKEKGLYTDTMVLVSTPEEQCALKFQKKQGDVVTPEDVIFSCEKK